MFEPYGPTHLGQTYPYVACFPFEFQIHGFTFGLLVSSVGVFLGLTQSLRRGNKLVYLAFMGDFSGYLGVSILSAYTLLHHPGNSFL